MGHDELGASVVRDQPWSSGFGYPPTTLWGGGPPEELQSRTLSRDQSSPGSFDWYSNIYGIRALKSSRARHFNLFGQDEPQAMRVSRWREPDGLDRGTRHDDPVIDRMNQVSLLFGHVGASQGLAESAEPFDGAIGSDTSGRALARLVTRSRT